MSASRILFPPVHRDPEVEFPKQFLSDFILASLEENRRVHGNQALIVSLNEDLRNRFLMLKSRNVDGLEHWL